MDQKTLKTIGAAAVGISAVIFVIAWLGMLVEFTGGFAMFEHISGTNPEVTVIYFITWFSLAMFLLMIPFLLGCVLCLFSKSKRMRIVTASVGCAIIVGAIAFMIVVAFIPHYGGHYISETALQSVMVYQGELISIIVPTLFISVAVLIPLFQEAKKNTEMNEKSSEEIQE